MIISSFHFQNSCRSRRPLALYNKKECLSRLLSVFPLQHDGMHDFLIYFFLYYLAIRFCCFCLNFVLPPIVRALYVTLGRSSSGRDDEESSAADWMVDPLRLSQLKEQYRRDRAKNRKGLVARKLLSTGETEPERHEGRYSLCEFSLPVPCRFKVQHDADIFLNN